MNILKKTFLKENLRSELKMVKNSLLRTSTMNPSISFKNVFTSGMNASINSALKNQNSKNLNNFSKYFFSSNLPRHINLTMPSLSPTMTKGNIVRWELKEGDAIKQGDSIASIETDKAQVDFQVNEDGYVAKLLFADGAKDIDVGELVAILAEKKSDIEAFKNYTGEQINEPTTASQTTSEPAKVEEKPQQKVESAKQETADRLFASPLAKKTAQQSGVDLNTISGTGPSGRIIQADVLEAKPKAPQPQISKPAVPVTPSTPSTPSVDYEDIEISNVRKIIAERLLFSKTNIPHFYVNVECNVDKLMETRAELNKHSPVKISVNDMIIKACSLACMKVPETNSSWQGNTIRKYKNVDMSIAVSSDNGLITPIIPQANLKGLAEISREMTELKEKAKLNKLKPHEFIGGTFTISNMGMMNITSFSAIINPPQSCILAVGKSEKKVIFDENAKNKDQPYKVVNVMNTTLSCDHRVVDGSVAAKWIQEFKSLIENPQLMLL